MTSTAKIIYECLCKSLENDEGFHYGVDLSELAQQITKSLLEKKHLSENTIAYQMTQNSFLQADGSYEANDPY